MLNSTGTRVLILEDVPTRDESVRALLNGNPNDMDTKCVMPREKVYGRLAPMVETERKFAALLGVTFLATSEFFCSSINDQCICIVGNIRAYYDQHHITQQYAAFIAPYVDIRLGQLKYFV